MEPTLYMAVGLPGSGKSTWAKQNKEILKYNIHSSDGIREELGDVNDQSRNTEVFNTLRDRIKTDLNTGNSVFMDATNLSRRRRTNFLKHEVGNIFCKKVCILFVTDFAECVRRATERKRKIPHKVMNKMIKNFETPWYSEGFNSIYIIWDFDHIDSYDYLEDLQFLDLLPHDNHHHSLTIGEHMRKAENVYVKKYKDDSKRSELLQYAVLLHDMGKPFCKTFLDRDGNNTEEAKYYQHHNVGAYYGLFYMKYISEYYKYCNKLTDEDILYVSLLINLHMKYFSDWKESLETKDKAVSLFGKCVIDDLDKLHDCDLEAH